MRFSPRVSCKYRSGLRRAAKPDMGGGTVHRLRMPRRGPVTPAVILRAQMRAALEHLAPEAMRAIARIAAAGLIAAPRIARRTAGSRGTLRGIGFAVPVGRPLPDIADHVD